MLFMAPFERLGQMGLCEFKDSLFYRASSGPASTV